MIHVHLHLHVSNYPGLVPWSSVIRTASDLMSELNKDVLFHISRRSSSCTTDVDLSTQGPKKRTGCRYVHIKKGPNKLARQNVTTPPSGK